MEAAIRFSQNSLPGQAEQYFLKVDVAGRAIQLYNITGKRKGVLQHELVYASNKLQPFRAFDWHPSEATLVAIGQTGGEAALVNLADTQQQPVSFPVRSQRSCNAVGLNTKNWIAIGLDKVRNDVCLNIWDVNQRTSGASSRSYGKSGSEPLYKLAAGEPITSLRFFQDQPQLLAAGVKGQFIRLYDLRESTSASALNFQTRCVNNIALDTQDENYLASCLPSNSPTISIWDRRMITRTNISQVGFGGYTSQADEHPEASAELRSVVDPQGQIWGLRFSKTHRGCLGVLSSTGQLRMLSFVAGGDPILHHDETRTSLSWDKQEPRQVYLDRAYNFSNAYFERPVIEEAKRVVSFDFTTATSPHGEPKILILTGEGVVELKPSAPPKVCISSSFLQQLNSGAHRQQHEHTLAVGTDSEDPGGVPPLISNFAISSSALSRMKMRCEAGYRLDATHNASIVHADAKLEAFWTWLRHAQIISAESALTYGGIDLSYTGIFGIWMEEVDIRARSAGNSYHRSSFDMSSMLREIARRLHLARGRGCTSEYPQNRALCLHVLGLPSTPDGVQHQCEVLIARSEHARAAALALFAGETKLAQKALRAKGSGNSHKMLAMALVGAKNRNIRKGRSNLIYGRSRDADSDSEQSQNEEWEDLVTSVAEELNDCYSKSILAFVKLGSWDDVVRVTSLPLSYRLMVALRHFDDSKLTKYLSGLKQDVLKTSNLEGVLLTGLGSRESIELLRSYARLTNDIQTAALGMSFAAASDRFLPRESAEARMVFCFREAYKQQLLSCGMKFEKVRFEVALSQTLREHNVSTQPRKKEQVRLICSHCNQSLSQFGHEQQVSEASANMTDTPKHPLAPEKAAIAGVVCPKCGRHLPRCGVCDLWLGTPDETFSKWYKSPSASQRDSNSVDLSASLVGSTVTAIGPNPNPPSVAIAGLRGSDTSESKKLTTVDLPPDAVEIVDEDLLRQEREKKWYEAMHKFTVFCTMCSHNFHAEHARQWFDGIEGREGHRICPVPLCECLCRG